MKKINVKNLMINLSLLIFVLVCTVRYYIDNFFGSNTALVLLIGANILLLINIISNKKIMVTSEKYFIVGILLFLPSLYKNGYLSNRIYEYFLYYFFTITYSILLCFVKIDKNNIKFVLKGFIIFALMTGFVTWLSFFYPEIYISKFIPLMPSNIHQEILLNFTKLNSRMGLTSHYSRNAFYLILGILSSLYFYLDEHKKKDLYSIIFFIITMLLVGKRGHLIFIVLSFIISYFIFNRVSIKVIFKFLGLSVAAIFLCMMIIKLIPETNYTFERIFNNTSEDISSGRFEMYNDIFKMYKNNDYTPIGWSQYASNTAYTHPGVHNDYIQLFCETGFVGFLIVVGCNLYILKKIIKFSQQTKSVLAFVALIYNVFFLLYSLTGLPHYDVETYMYYFLINSIMFYVMSNKINIEEGEAKV